MVTETKRPAISEGAAVIEMVELSKNDAAEFWPEILPYVNRALEFDPYNSVDVKDLVQQVGTGFARVLIAVRGDELLSATVVQLYKTVAGRRVVHVVTTAGQEVGEWLPLLIDSLRAIAVKEKAEGVTMGGRPGWSKKLVKYGFKVAHVTMQMRVEQ